ncbi:MAG: nucleoside 2-deoxyribosyltransferase [Anaerolineae bacterium]|jgi:nucleoside 2-deoxyribosyltransferase
MSKRAYLICPVRGHDMSETADLVRRLEDEGWEVHWPPRDTDQVDETGYRICRDNRRAIEEADVVFVVWDGRSKGCLFDLGMAFAMGKPVRVVELPAHTEERSFQKMVREWERRTRSS